MTLLPRTAQSLFKMHPPRGGNDFWARGCTPPQTFNDSFEFLAERPCVGARQTEDAPSTIGVGVCDRGSKVGGGLVDPMCKSFTENTRTLQVVQEHSRVSGIFMLNSDFLFTFKSQSLSSEFDFFFSIHECDEMTALKFCTFNRSPTVSVWNAFNLVRQLAWQCNIQ